LEAEAGEGAGDTSDGFVEFAPGEADVLMADDDGFAIGDAGSGLGENFAEEGP
jgi:hypothetical protein